MSSPRGDYIIEINIRDRHTGLIVDKGKVINQRGWGWLLSKYFYDFVMLSWEDVDKISKMRTVEEVAEYVEDKQKNK